MRGKWDNATKSGASTFPRPNVLKETDSVYRRTIVGIVLGVAKKVFWWKKPRIVAGGSNWVSRNRKALRRICQKKAAENTDKDSGQKGNRASKRGMSKRLEFPKRTRGRD